MSGRLTRQNKPLNVKGFSNLIFQPHLRSSADSPGTSPCSRRTRSILLLRGNSSKTSSVPSKDRYSSEQVLEVNSKQKINVINMMNGNNAMAPRLRSNYCKKITLSNLDKYYEYCVKKVKSFTSDSLDLRQVEQRKLESPSAEHFKQVNESRRNLITADGYRVEARSLNLKKRERGCESMDEISTPKLIETPQDTNFWKNQLDAKAPDFAVVSHQSAKIPYSSFCRKRPRASKRYTPACDRERDQFKINGWETPDLVIQEDML